MKKRERRKRGGAGEARPVRKVLESRAKSIGRPPGSLTYIGRKHMDRPVVTMIAYDDDRVVSQVLEEPGQAKHYMGKYRVVWVNIDGLHDTSMIESAGEVFGIEGLTLEDILHTGQRAKVEEFDRYLFFVMQMLEFNGVPGGISREQLSFVVGDGFVLTFQELSGDMFDSIRQRIESAGTRIRRQGPDFLFFSLADAVVDNYLSILEEVENAIDAMEAELLEGFRKETFESVYTLKRELIILRKSVWPLREAVGKVMRDDFRIIGNEVGPYFRDLYDHVILVIDTVEVFRDIVTGMHETYLASVNNRMNEVMKFLTMIATIFMPLSFIAGLYGMNFRYMPELEWRWGYFAVLGVMAVIFFGMVWFYRSRKWY